MNQESPNAIGTINPNKDAFTQQKYTLIKGISDNHIIQLIEFTNDTNDEELQTHTSDHLKGKGRFSSLENFTSWQKDKKRIIYSLVDEEGNLAGITWLGHKNLDSEYKIGLEVEYLPGATPQNYSNTIGIRIYGKARGTGLATNFARKSISDYSNKIPGKIWLVTDKSNHATINTFYNLGFKRLTSWTIEDRVILGQSIPID